MVFVNITEMSQLLVTAKKKKKVLFWSLSAKNIVYWKEVDLLTVVLKNFLCKLDWEVLTLKMYTSFEAEMTKLQVRFCRKILLFVGYFFFES